MSDQKATREQLLNELSRLRKRIAHLEALESECEQVKAALLEDIEHVESLLQIFAVGASTELERKQTVEALQKERDRAQQYLDIAGVMLVALDSQGEITLMNRKGHAILGYPEGELLGKDWFDTCVPPRLREQVWAVYRQLMTGDVTPSEYFENKILTKAGEERIIAWHNTILTDDRGRVVGTLSSGEDITQRKQAEATLHRRQEQLEALRQVGLEITAQLDLDVVLHSIVSRAIDLLNANGGGFYLYRPERDVLEWVITVGSNMVPIGATLRRGQGLSGKVWQHGEPLIVEDYATWEGRSSTYEGHRFAAVVGVPVYWGSADAGGEFLGVLDVLADAPRTFTPADTELLTLLASQAAIAIQNARLFQAEQQRRLEAEALRQAATALGSTLDLEEVLERILEQVAHVIPGDGTRLMLLDGGSARVVRWQGYERFGMDASIKSLVLPIADFPLLRHMVETGDAVYIPDTWADARWVRRPENDWLRSYAAAPIHNRDRVVGFLTVDSASPGFYTAAHAESLETFAVHAGLALQNAWLYRDLQDRMVDLHEAQSQLVQSAKMAAVGQLAAGVAHELNNPLTSVLGFAELLMWQANPGDPDWEDLNAIAEEARRARNIVRSLLDFARQSESSPEPSDVNELLAQTLALLRRQLANEDVKLVEQYASDLPSLMLSINGIKQIFLNLVSNALQAMPRGGTLTVTTELLGDEVAVRIADTGTGIPEEKLPHIFEPFFTTKPVGQGTGLGLSVSLGIAQDHGGRITVQSRVGEGTVFTVWLPITPGALASDPHPVL
ncbi:MAG: GAF domain-containing protein [Anaerolineae bacterium]|jgi:two-component system NtrC family sensor kinase